MMTELIVGLVAELERLLGNRPDVQVLDYFLDIKSEHYNAEVVELNVTYLRQTGGSTE